MLIYNQNSAPLQVSISALWDKRHKWEDYFTSFSPDSSRAEVVLTPRIWNTETLRLEFKCSDSSINTEKILITLLGTKGQEWSCGIKGVTMQNLSEVQTCKSQVEFRNFGRLCLPAFMRLGRSNAVWNKSNTDQRESHSLTFLSEKLVDYRTTNIKYPDQEHHHPPTALP